MSIFLVMILNAFLSAGVSVLNRSVFHFHRLHGYAYDLVHSLIINAVCILGSAVMDSARSCQCGQYASHQLIHRSILRIQNNHGKSYFHSVIHDRYPGKIAVFIFI